MKARELIEKIMKVDNLNTEIDFRKFFSDGEDKDNDRFIIGFKERKDV